MNGAAAAHIGCLRHGDCQTIQCIVKFLGAGDDGVRIDVDRSDACIGIVCDIEVDGVTERMRPQTAASVESTCSDGNFLAAVSPIAIVDSIIADFLRCGSERPICGVFEQFETVGGIAVEVFESVDDSFRSYFIIFVSRIVTGTDGDCIIFIESEEVNAGIAEQPSLCGIALAEIEDGGRAFGLDIFIEDDVGFSADDGDVNAFGVARLDAFRTVFFHIICICRQQGSSVTDREGEL